MSTGLLFAALSGALVSSLVPVVNAELLLIGLSLAAAPASAPLLVVAFAVGQMIGKSTLFLTGGRLTRTPVGQRLTRWGLDGRTKRAGIPLIALSASVGMPPFYLVSVAAPSLGVRFRTFVMVGLAGRIVRFAAVVAVPAVVSAFTQ